jgi:hypothetical protein
MNTDPPISAQPRQDAARTAEERRLRLGPDAVGRANEIVAAAPPLAPEVEAALALLLARTEPIGKRGAA